MLVKSTQRKERWMNAKKAGDGRRRRRITYAKLIFKFISVRALKREQYAIWSKKGGGGGVRLNELISVTPYSKNHLSALTSCRTCVRSSFVDDWENKRRERGKSIGDERCIHTTAEVFTGGKRDGTIRRTKKNVSINLDFLDADKSETFFFEAGSRWLLEKTHTHTHTRTLNSSWEKSIMRIRCCHWHTHATV